MLQPMRELTFRPSPAPGIASPLTVRSAGHYRLGDRPESNAPRAFSQLFWVREGRVRYRRKGRLHACGAGEGFFYAAKEPHHVAAGDPPGDYYWATFDGPWVGQWLAAQGFGPGPRRAGPCPVELFEALRERIRQPSVAAEEQAAEWGLRLLIQFAAPGAAGPRGDTDPDEALCRQLERVIETHHTEADFGIEAAAEALGCHRSTLFRIYRRRRGIPPSAYLQRLRVQRALELLRTAAGPIAEIAPACGFRDPNYFAKVIRRATGEPPQSIRRGRALLPNPGSRGTVGP